MFYHLSLDIDNIIEKTFIPKNHNDNTYSRIRVSNSIEGAVRGLYHYPIYRRPLTNKIILLTVYEVSNESVNFITPNKLQYEGLVPNAKNIGEHWITDNFKSSPYLIKINKLNLSENESSIEYENEIEPYTRTEHMTLLKKKQLVSFLALCKKHGILVNKVEIIKDKLTYTSGNSSQRVHSIYNVEYIIPSDVSARDIWILKAKTFELYEKRKLNYFN
jgi:hypothetical protein